MIPMFMNSSVMKIQILCSVCSGEQLGDEFFLVPWQLVKLESTSPHWKFTGFYRHLMLQRGRRLGIFFGISDNWNPSHGYVLEIIMRFLKIQKNMVSVGDLHGKWRISRRLWRFVIFMIFITEVQNLHGVIKGRVAFCTRKAG
jgi:hypothetical protein